MKSKHFLLVSFLFLMLAVSVANRTEQVEENKTEISVVYDEVVAVNLEDQMIIKMNPVINHDFEINHFSNKEHSIVQRSIGSDVSRMKIGSSGGMPYDPDLML